MKIRPDSAGAPPNENGTRGRGRPRKPETTRLVAALIAKQDAMSRRTARKIDAILDTHVNAGAVAFTWARACRVTRATFDEVIETMCTRIVPDNPEFRGVVTQLVGEALEELQDDACGPPPAVCPPEEPRPRVKTSATLADARAQQATLAAYLMDLTARIVRLDDVAPRRPRAAPHGGIAR